jgi:hypothetical protein
MLKLLTMCSTRSRPDRFYAMAKSFVETKESPNSVLVAYVFEGDPRISEYRALDFSGMDCVSIVYGKDRNMVNVLNYLSTILYYDYDYYSEVNDDHIFITHGWDLKMMYAINKKNNGVAIAYGYTRNLPTATMFSAIIVRGLGFFFPPEFKHTWVDNWLADIGFSTNILTYVPCVNIEHRHYVFGLAEKDSVYDFANNDMQYGKAAYYDWVTNRRDKEFAIIESLKDNNKTTNAECDDFFSKHFSSDEIKTITPSDLGNMKDCNGTGFIVVSKKILLNHRLPENFNPLHPDWNIPSFKNRYAAAVKESKIEKIQLD